MTIPTYNPKKVAVYFNGKILSGFAPGTFVEISRNADGFSTEVGADGEGARVASNDFSGKVKIILQATSRSNDVMSALQVADELGNVGTGALMIKDASGRTVVNAAEAWIVKPADVSFGDDFGTREWVIESALIRVNVGGN